MTDDALPLGSRRALAAHWSNVALLEHASIASFSVFSLELLALGAPAALIAGAHRAALDEVEHAKLAFRLASRYAGEPLGPGPLPVHDLSLATDLCSLAASTASEGCVGETVGAVEARAGLERATDEEVRRVLAIVERDESSHAELAWQTARWALDRGGSKVRDALIAAFRHELGAPLVAAPALADPAILAAHGVLPPAELVDVRRRALVEVVGPAVSALLGPLYA